MSIERLTFLRIIKITFIICSRPVLFLEFGDWPRTQRRGSRFTMTSRVTGNCGGPKPRLTRVTITQRQPLPPSPVRNYRPLKPFQYLDRNLSSLSSNARTNIPPLHPPPHR